MNLPDARYTAKREYCGYSTPMIVVRFCGDSIGICRTESKAEFVAKTHDAERQTTLAGETPE